MRFIPNAVTSKAALALLKTQKHSPTLLFAGGVVGIVTTVVLAARATLKLNEIVEETEHTLEQIDSVISGHVEGYTEEDCVKDKALVYAKTVIKIGKLYGPSIVLGAASIGMLAGSHRILTRRNVALTAAYSALEKGFKQYRDRVIEDLGEESDRKYLHGVEKQKTVVVDQDGKKQSVTVEKATRTSPYGRLFRPDNPNWTHVPEYNYLFLRGHQNYLNDRLQSRGYVFLNDVYDALGFDRSREGQMVGWLKNGDGDGYIDFGIFDDASMLRVHDYLVGHEGELFLDFNVDGLIQNKI